MLLRLKLCVWTLFVGLWAILTFITTVLERFGVMVFTRSRLYRPLIRYYEFKTWINPANTVDSLSRKGFILELQGELDQAAACFKEVTQLEPRNALHYWDLGCVYEKQNENVLAASSFADALQFGAELPREFTDELRRRISKLTAKGKT